MGSKSKELFIKMGDLWSDPTFSIGGGMRNGAKKRHSGRADECGVAQDRPNSLPLGTLVIKVPLDEQSRQPCLMHMLGVIQMVST